MGAYQSERLPKHSKCIELASTQVVQVAIQESLRLGLNLDLSISKTLVTSL